MKRSLRLLLIPILSSSMLHAMTATETSNNPFFNEWNTSYGTIPFESIHKEHYMPAVRHGLEIEEAEIDAIIHNDADATFENTIVAMDNTGEFLQRVIHVFNNLSGTDSDEEMQAIDLEMTPLLSAHYASIRLNPDLFQRVKVVYAQKDSLNLDLDQAKLLEDTYQSFVRGGALLNEEEKARYKEIVGELSVLTLKFGDNVRKDTTHHEIVVEDESVLDGVPEFIVKGGAKKAAERGMEGKWLFLPTRSNVEGITTYGNNRELRKQLFEAYVTCGDRGNEYDNNALIPQILNLRLEKAKLLGYKSHADYVLADRMAKTSDAVMELALKVWEPAIAAAKKDIAEMQALVESDGDDFKVEAWDYRYYMERIRAAKYALDEAELMEYFTAENVRHGIFILMNKLYGVNVEPAPEVQTYRDDVQAWKVTEADGSLIGIFYSDYFIRDSKRSGAWMNAFRPQSIDKSGERIAPHIINVLNAPAGTGDTPAMLTLDLVSTAFHEFGHATHGLFSNVRYNGQAGTSVTRDFVELPSQILENWAFEPALLKQYAVHYKTGEPISDELIEKIVKAGKFNQGFYTTEYMAATLLDIEYHMIEEPFEGNIPEFEKEILTEKYGLVSEIFPRYRSTYFQHIFSGGYSAGYYGYLWAEVLDADAFEAFKEKGVFDVETAHLFREHVLSKGGSDDPMKLYKAFRGRGPETDPLLKRRGFL